MIDFAALSPRLTDSLCAAPVESGLATKTAADRQSFNSATIWVDTISQ